MESGMSKEKRNMALMSDIAAYVDGLDELYDVGFYVNGHRYFTDLSLNADKPRVEVSDGVFMRDEGEYNVADYVEYCNPDTLTMTFEGPFYADYNGDVPGRGYQAEEDMTRIGEKYGLYPQQGYAWSLTFYEIPERNLK